MQKKTIVIIILCSFILVSYGQETKIDTSNYISGDLDYNLILASEKGYSLEVLRLLNEGANVNADLGNGVTPLMYAVQEGHFDVVKILVLNGADVNKVPDNGNSALIAAVLADSLDIAEYLIRHGADIDQADYNKVTPLMQSVANGSYYMTDMLLYYGADVLKKDIHGTDALMLSSLLGLYEIDSLLIEHGANVNSTDNKLLTPLHMAVQNGYIEIAGLLIEKGADINMSDVSGYTPLGIAVENNDLNMVRFLVDKGAKVNTKISNSQNALTIALDHKNDSIIHFLLEHKSSRIIWPSFNKYFIGTELNWNSKDFLWGFNVGISDKKYNLEIFADYRFRPSAIAVLQKESEHVSYQYRERRGSYSIGLDKKFQFNRKPAFTNYGLFTGIKETLTFGSYRGSSNKPDTRLLTVPRVGVYLNYFFINSKFYYEFLNLDLPEISNGRWNFAFYFNIDRKKNSYNPKYIYWL